MQNNITGSELVKMATQEQLNNIRTDIDWGALGFSYMPVRSHIRCSYKDGKWNSGVLMNEHTITMTHRRDMSPLWAGCFRGTQGVPLQGRHGQSLPSG